MERNFCCRVVSNGRFEFRERLFTEMNKKFAEGDVSLFIGAMGGIG